MKSGAMPKTILFHEFGSACRLGFRVRMKVIEAAGFVLLVLPCAGAPLLQAGSMTPSAALITSEDFANELPVHYSGVLPCADCEGIRYDVDLRENNVYFMRMSYLGRSSNDPIDQIGLWSVVVDTQTLVLQAGDDTSEMFSIVDSTVIRKLDRAGIRIDSQLNYELTRDAAYAPIEPNLRMQGMYRYLADAGLFEECLTGLRLPVAAEGADAALEAAYVQVSSEPGAPVLARLSGRIVSPRGMGDERTRDMLIVDAFDDLAPNESCGARGVTHDLVGTRWVLVRLAGQAVVLGKDDREPSIALQTASPRVVGFDGCNRLMGDYRIDGDRIEFSQMATPLMACPDMRVAEGLAEAMAVTVRWQVSGAHLELFDAAGTVQARFESRNL